MTQENPRGFKKFIVLGKSKGSIVTKSEGKEDEVTANKTKEKRISPDLLENLRSLAIVASDEAGDSAGQAKLNQEMEKLKKKFPNEEPDEVWRRTLATLVADGVDAETVAEKLLITNDKFYIKQNLGEMSGTERDNRIGNLRKEILKYWPSPSGKV